ncbi:MAG: class II fructose-bisphosphatase [Peptostreptococcaceae bacterium]|nr:class II fructose-bisphosphatase [Peptostreptococcaceae bacterium]
MDRNLALELVRVTETAALASAAFMGRGDKNGADGAAVEGMRKAFESVNVKGEVVIGEGELDEAPMLYIGEKVGCGEIEVDIAVDPLDGTSLIAKSLPNAIAVIAMGAKNSLLKAPDTYMEKIMVGPKGKGLIDIDDSVTNNITRVAKAMNKRLKDMTIIVQDRKRHDDIVKEARDLGVRIKFFDVGDIAAGLATCFNDSDVDMLFGIGGGPEGVIAAAALKCMGGDMQARIHPLSEEEYQRCYEMNFTKEEISKKLTLEDLAKGEELFFAATGVTSGEFLKGVTYKGEDMMQTQSVVMRNKTKTVRFVDAIHRLDKNDIIEELMEKYKDL